MILFPTDLLTEAMDQLPPEVRSIVKLHFLDGESIHRIQRQRKMKLRDVESIIANALEAIRTVLKDYGISGMADLG